MEAEVSGDANLFCHCDRYQDSQLVRSPLKINHARSDRDEQASEVFDPVKTITNRWQVSERSRSNAGP